MCIACELGFWSMIDALPPDARERYLGRLGEQDETARFGCDAPEQKPAPPTKPPEDERAP